MWCSNPCFREAVTGQIMRERLSHEVTRCPQKPEKNQALFPLSLYSGDRWENMSLKSQEKRQGAMAAIALQEKDVP
jgi:hypothetical protein